MISQWDIESRYPKRKYHFKTSIFNTSSHSDKQGASATKFAQRVPKNKNVKREKSKLKTQWANLAGIIFKAQGYGLSSGCFSPAQSAGLIRILSP